MKRKTMLLVGLGAAAIFLISRRNAAASPYTGGLPAGALNPQGFPSPLPIGAGNPQGFPSPLPIGALDPQGFPSPAGTPWGGSPWNDPNYMNPEGFQSPQVNGS